MVQPQQLVVMVLFLTIVAGASQSKPRLVVRTLLPNEELFGEEIGTGEINYYRLDALAPDSTYELRLSYSGVYPFEFQFEVLSAEDTETAWHSRSLLNIEKLTFETDANGHLLDISSPAGAYVVAVRAAFAGVMPASQVAAIPRVPYNIIFERTTAGLPSSSIRMIALLVVLLALALVFLAPFIARSIYNSTASHSRTDKRD